MNLFWIIVIVLLIFWFVRSFHLAAAKVNSANQDYKSALAHWEAVYYKKPNPANGIQFGYLLLRSGEFERAAWIFQEVLKMDKLTEQSKLQTEAMLGLITWKQGDLEGAISTFEELHQREENTVIYANLGFLYLLRDAGDETMSFLKNAYEYNDTNPVIVDNMAEGYIRTHQWEKAEELLERAVKFPRPIAESYYHYGIVLEHNKEYEEAISYFEKAENMDLNVLSGLNREEIRERIDRLKHLTENEDE